jgi:hypothetical protein
MLHSLFYLETSLHVSGGTFTHHQERKQLYLQHLVFVAPLLLSDAIVGVPHDSSLKRLLHSSRLTSWDVRNTLAVSPPSIFSQLLFNITSLPPDSVTTCNLCGFLPTSSARPHHLFGTGLSLGYKTYFNIVTDCMCFSLILLAYCLFQGNL